MSCNSKINSLDYLIKNGATDDIRKILDLSLFNELNNTLTEYAKTKYNLETGDEKLFSINEYQSIYLKDTPYYRESTYKVQRALPNEALFEQLDILVSEYENRPDTNQPMFMKTPSVNYSLKIVETLGKINRGTFETSKLQPSFEFDLSTVQNARAKEIVSVLSQRLSLGLKVNYANITQEQAIDLLKRTKVPYQGEPGFYFAGTIYTVGDNVSINTLLHEFSHPLLQGIAVSNPELFNNLFNLLESTTEGQQIVDYVTEMYPELKKDSIKFKEEALAWSLQTHAANILANKIETKGFDSFIKNLLYQIKLLLKKVFGNEKVIKDLNVNTSIEKLAKMLLEKDFVFESSNIKEEDVAMFLRNETEKAKVLIDNASTKAITESINAQYSADKAILDMASNYRTNEKTKKIVIESFIEKGTTKLLPGVLKSLRPYQTILKFNNNSIDVILDNALEAEAARLKDLNNRALSLVNSLEVTNNVTNIIIDKLEDLKKKSNFGDRNDIYLLGLYRNALARWYQSNNEIDAILSKDFVMDNTNPFSQLLGQINTNIIRGEKIAVEISKTNSINFFTEIGRAHV